jgi:hypothetical protein
MTIMEIPKLSFIVPGFSKCGTTSLCNLLNIHPDIHIPQDKEPLFFIRPDYEKCWNHYHGFFGEYAPEQLLGEGSTFYTAIDHEIEARQRILKHYPNIKFIFIARDPIDRIESSFREFHHSGPRFEINTPQSLEDALLALPAMISDTMYWARLQNYLKYLDESQVHIVFLEDLKVQPKTELKKCFEFLDLKEISISQNPTILNDGGGKLFDSPLTQYLRKIKLIKKPSTDNSFNRQNKILKLIRLRKNFPRTTAWSNDAKERVTLALRQDTAEFLNYCQKDANFWKRSNNLYNQYSQN